MLRLLARVSCGTRTVIDAVFGPVSAGKTTCATGLLGSLHAGMVLLADRNFGAGVLPRMIKRARHNSYRVKRPGDTGIRHPGPRRRSPRESRDDSHRSLIKIR